VAAHWAPDLAYHVVATDTLLGGASNPNDGEHFVVCMIRDDILFVRSTATGGTVAFMASREPLEVREMMARINASAEQLAQPLENLEFGFLTLYAKGRAISAIVDMKGATQTRHLRLRAISPPDGTRQNKIVLSKELHSFLTEKTYPVGSRVFRLFECD
jgi:hypothetical protein